MSRPMRFLCAIALSIGAVLIIVEAPAEIQRTFGRPTAISYLLALLVGLCVTVGGAFIFFRAALRKDEPPEPPSVDK